jgi:integrase
MERDRAPHRILWFGKDKLVTEITGDDVTRLVAWRRGHRVTKRVGKGGTRIKEGALILPATVNITTEQLKKLFTRAKTWGIHLRRESRWKDHWLKEPKERVRELTREESERLKAVTRDDYARFFDFAEVTGFRLNECLLRWSEVDWDARQVKKTGKGGGTVVTHIDATLRDILWPLRGHHPEFVFTFVAQRTRPGRGMIKGQRYPLTYQGVVSEWRRLRNVAGIECFRFHDYRHNLGTKVLRQTGNLKLMQRALNHADIRSTMRYAHVLDEDVADALTRFRESRNNSPTAAKRRA